MTTLLERLIDLVVGWIKHLLPYYILGDDCLGLVRRVGKYHRDLAPGWNWKIPVLEEVQECSSAIESVSVRNQTVTTSDGKAVTVAGVVGYHITNARRYLLKCGDAASVMNDLVCGIIGEVVPKHTAAQVLGPECVKACRLEMRKRSKKWGVVIDSFGFSDRVTGPAFHVLGVK